MVESLTAERILDELRSCAVTHVIWLPDTLTRFMYDALIGQNEIKLIPVCREGEAIAIAAGLILGGKNPVVLHQDTGLFDSGDSIRGLALDLNLPILLILGFHGWRQDPPSTHSAARFTEPILDAWGIKHYRVFADHDAGIISKAYREAREAGKPIAVLMGRSAKKS